MTTPRWHYDRETVAAALRAAGVREGDVVFAHVGLAMLGFPAGERTEANAADTVLDAYLSVLGDAGTLLVPTYSYTFTKGEVFDVAQTPSDVGPVSERMRARPGAVRSADPLFSVAALGPRGPELLADLPHDCFGPGCVYDRLVDAGASIVNAGVGFRYATFIHHAEQVLAVPYRYPKRFLGTIRESGTEREEVWTYNVRPLDEPGADPDLRRLEQLARDRRILHEAPCGRGSVTVVGCAELMDLCREAVAADPWFLSAAGHAGLRPAISPEVDASGAPLTVRLGADRLG